MGRQACRAGNTCKQARRACTAAKACMQTGPIGAGYKRREVLREESRMALSKGLCTRCQGSTARKDGEGHTVAGASVTPGVFTGDDEEAWRALQFKRTRWPHLLLLCPCMRLACSNSMWFVTEAALETHERVVSGARATRARDESWGRHGYAASLIYAIGDRKAEKCPEPLRPPPCWFSHNLARPHRQPAHLRTPFFFFPDGSVVRAQSETTTGTSLKSLC